ncbi:Alpha/Beta hydrolase protein [Aspergillus cavernicola]|uniref:Dipeptidyl-peptidase V n=1 Tax=Aspergillus cavernicola TaxID=176166 RepID=A0ABR4IAI0_9EURO
MLRPKGPPEASRHSHAIPTQQHTSSLRGHTETREICPVTNGPNAGFPQWLGHSDQLIWLEGTWNGHTQLIVTSARRDSESYVAGTIPGPVRYLRTNPDGTLFNSFGKAEPMSGTSTSQRNAIWFGRTRHPSGASGVRYSITNITNLMTYFRLGPVEVRTPEYILFTAKDPEVDQSTHTACLCYICPMLTWDSYPIPDDYYKAFWNRGLGGRISSPCVDSSRIIVFLSQRKERYAADKNQIVTVTNINTGEYKELFASQDGKGSWGLSPSAVSLTSNRLLIQVEEKGQWVLYALSLVDVTEFPSSTKLLASCDNFYHEREFIIADPVTEHARQWKAKTWNLALLAERGYVVVAPNIPGSTGYGQDFADSTSGSWGGAPLIDLEQGLEHIQSGMQYVDTTRAVALGHGYGWYLVNWIQGHALGRKFKGLVTDNGIVSMISQLTNPVQHALFHEMGENAPWEDAEEWKKWDPTGYLENWNTPHLIIHGEQNQQYPASNGLAAFRTLQLRRVESRLLVFPDEGHEVHKPENALLWYRVVLGWMDRLLRDNELVDTYCAPFAG